MAKRKSKISTGANEPLGIIPDSAELREAIKRLDEMPSAGTVWCRVAADDPRTDAEIRSVLVRQSAAGHFGKLTPDDVISAKVYRGKL